MARCIGNMLTRVTKLIDDAAELERLGGAGEDALNEAWGDLVAAKQNLIAAKNAMEREDHAAEARALAGQLRLEMMMEDAR